MSLPPFIRHNQTFFAALAISALILGGMLGCQLTESQKRQVISTAADSAIAVAAGKPIPWSQIGLAIGTLLGGGAVVDNRRKDVLIKRLKNESAHKDTLLSPAPPRANGPQPVQPPPHPS